MQNLANYIIVFFVLISIQFGIAQNSQTDTLEARQMYQKGNRYFEALSFDSSIFYFQSASKLWASNESWKEYIASERSIAECYIRKGMTLNALKVLTTLETSLDVDKNAYFSDVIKIKILKSYLLNNKGEYREALNLLLLFLHEHPEVEQEKNENTALLYYSLSNAYGVQGDYETSNRYLQKTKNIREELYGKDHISLSRIYISAGNNYSRTNDFGAAITQYNTALQILERNSRSESDDAAYCYLYLMSAFNDIGEYSKAIKYGKQSIELYTKLNLQDHPNVASAFGKLGEIYTTLGDFEKAKEYTQQSLVLFSSRYPEKLTAQASLYQRLADVYNKSGDYKRALEYSLKGITLSEQSYGTEHPQTGFMYELAAGIYSSRNEQTKALEFLTKALVIRSHVTGRESFGDIVSLHLSIAEVYLAMHNNDSALVHLNLAHMMEERSQVKNIPQRALLQQRFGDLYFARKEYMQALASYQNALLILIPSHESDIANVLSDIRKSYYKKEGYEILVRLGDTYEAMYKRHQQRANLKHALMFYQTAMELVDDVRKQYSADVSKFILADQSKVLYAKACGTALALYKLTKDPSYHEQAFLAADRSKANALLEQLFNQEAKKYAGIPDSLLQKENNLLASIASHEIKIQKCVEDSAAGNDALQKLRSENFILKRDHQLLVEYLEQKYPKYFQLKYAEYTITIKDVQQRLGTDEVLIEYVSNGSEMNAFALSRQGLVSTTIPRTVNIYRAAEQFTSSLKKYDSETYHSSGKRLYAQLLKPFEKIFAGKEKLIIVPDGMLHYVPFEALPTKQYQSRTAPFSAIPYLIRTHEVRYSYSAAFTVRMTDTVHSTSYSLAGFAPVFRDSTHNGDFLANRSFMDESGLSDVRSITLDGKTFNELKYSEDEVLSIGQSFRAHSLPAKNFLHTSATESNFKLFSRNYDVVHVATHGFINEKNPKLSAILFSQPQEQSDTDDGILYLNETFALELNAKLVVLSSCESGLGALVQGEGMMALTRGLFYAGAKNIIFSLWKVSDKQTYLLMDEFYKQMLSGKSYSSSLREAKLKLISSKESSFPSKWSGFVLMGE